ncbi:uncharacterized protein [Eulemur rufifrons]|uniref:uncharacterized protein isoform X2 n=1 Tax=Eulemur rufifrons TaxID=859984 RepID=UPI003743F82A
MRGPSPVKEQHLPPGVEMGRNGPEHRPGSETPHPLPRSGRRAGRKSLTLTPPPPFPSPNALHASRPLPSLLLLLYWEEGGILASPGQSCLRPQRRGRAGPRGGLRGREEVGLEEEVEIEGGEREGLKLMLAGRCVMTSSKGPLCKIVRAPYRSFESGRLLVARLVAGLDAVWLLMTCVGQALKRKLEVEMMESNLSEPALCFCYWLHISFHGQLAWAE